MLKRMYLSGVVLGGEPRAALLTHKAQHLLDTAARAGHF